jgi:hypothetical protein
MMIILPANDSHMHSRLYDSASEMLQLYEDPLPSDSPNGALRDSIDKKNSLLRGLFSTPSTSSITPPDAAPATVADSEATVLDFKAPQVSPVDLSNSAVDGSSSSSLGSPAVGVDLDQASDLSRSPWRQSESPFTVTPSTATTAVTAPKTSSEINMERKQKEKAGGRSVSRKAVSTKDTAENDNDVEWVVDAFNVDAPESTEAVNGMSSSGRSVNRRRQQLQQPQAPAALSTQESRIMKARLDELRKAYGLYVSDGTNEAVEKKLIDQFK